MENRLEQISRCLMTLTHEFLKVARVEDETQGFFDAKVELHNILADMAKEGGNEKIRV